MSAPWLVTGASGFLGGHVVETLVARGTPVRVLVRETSDTSVLDPLPIERTIGDLDDPSAVREAVEGVERVIHCGGMASDWGPREAFEAANIQGVAHLVEAALQAGVARVVHVSTTDVYGHPGEPVGEDAPLVERGWPYGDTKIAGERVARAAAERGLPLVVVRPASIWGPRSPSFVTEVVDLMRQRLMLTVSGGGTDAGLCYVANAVDALLLAAEHDAAVGRVYNLHDGAGTTWAAYLRALADVAGTPPPRISIPYRIAYATGGVMEFLWGAARIRARPLLTRMAVELMGTSQGFSTRRIREELGWEPRLSLSDGMERIGEWLAATGFH